MANAQRSTFHGLIVIVVLLLILVALLLPQIWRARRGAHVTGCASNLRSLWQSQFNYAAQYGRPNGDLPDDLGSDFFLRLQRTPKPLIDRYEPFFCPLAREKPESGRCSYRGPASSISTMSRFDPIAADKEGNHGPGAGGNVMTKAGDCFEVEAVDSAWIRARVTTKE